MTCEMIDRPELRRAVELVGLVTRQTGVRLLSVRRQFRRSSRFGRVVDQGDAAAAAPIHEGPAKFVLAMARLKAGCPLVPFDSS